MQYTRLKYLAQAQGIAPPDDAAAAETAAWHQQQQAQQQVQQQTQQQTQQQHQQHQQAQPGAAVAAAQLISQGQHQVHVLQGMLVELHQSYAQQVQQVQNAVQKLPQVLQGPFIEAQRQTLVQHFTQQQQDLQHRLQQAQAAVAAARQVQQHAWQQAQQTEQAQQVQPRHQQAPQGDLGAANGTKGRIFVPDKVSVCMSWGWADKTMQADDLRKMLYDHPWCLLCSALPCPSSWSPHAGDAGVSGHDRHAASATAVGGLPLR